MTLVFTVGGAVWAAISAPKASNFCFVHCASLCSWLVSNAQVKQSPIQVNPGHSTCLTCELDKDWRRETDSALAALRETLRETLRGSTGTDGSLTVGVDIIRGNEAHCHLGFQRCCYGGH